MRAFILLSVAGLAVGSTLAVAACSSSSGSSAASADAGTACASGDGALAADGAALTPCAWDQPVTQPSDTTATAGRAACKYKRGDMPAATLGPTDLPADIPIDNIVVVMMENHSFDSYLGHLNQYGNRTDVEVADAGATNPDVDGAAVPWAHAGHLCTSDTDHSWLGTHAENRRREDGRVRDGQRSGHARRRRPLGVPGRTRHVVVRPDRHPALLPAGQYLRGGRPLPLRAAGPDVAEPDVPHRVDELRADRQRLPGPDEVPVPARGRHHPRRASRSGTSAGSSTPTACPPRGSSTARRSCSAGVATTSSRRSRSSRPTRRPASCLRSPSSIRTSRPRARAPAPTSTPPATSSSASSSWGRSCRR